MHGRTTRHRIMEQRVFQRVLKGVGELLSSSPPSTDALRTSSPMPPENHQDITGGKTCSSLVTKLDAAVKLPRFILRTSE
ncbi:hypothetical protein C8035_v011801 [Colletotrichum spinosum]|uniref:Uncharacterized protein n=1 Tax=Colletotrichum spinosum TaxID=1347390 RepID=A0A4V3HRP3_9PEZI|nr:hypothetical protein C8035_v011801 [Colletotrichum spinosum]